MNLMQLANAQKPLSSNGGILSLVNSLPSDLQDTVYSFHNPHKEQFNRVVEELIDSNYIPVLGFDGNEYYIHRVDYDNGDEEMDEYDILYDMSL